MQRFYGKSVPFGDASFTHPYVDLLTAEQALADYSTLIGHIKLRLNATRCPVVAFGGRSATPTRGQQAFAVSVIKLISESLLILRLIFFYL